MTRPDNHQRKPWRITVGIVSILWIAFMWVRKDIASIYAAMPPEQVIPLMATTILVALGKTLLIAGAVLCINWGIEKIKKKRD